MIVYDLSCDGGHRFEGWFASSGDFSAQSERGLVSCPHCGSAEIKKAPMAPAVGKKGNQRSEAPRPTQQQETHPVANRPMPAEVVQALTRLAEVQTRALKNSRWVGEGFAEVSRAIHYGERDPESIHGEATPDEAQELIEEGIAIAPLPFPIAPPEEVN